MLFIMESFNAYFLGQKFDAVLNFSKPFKELYVSTRPKSCYIYCN